MILSNECWVKDNCKKGQLETAECKDSTIFCIKLFRLEYLYQRSLLPVNRWKHENLRLDANRIDENVFNHLISIQRNIENFIDRGDNLFIYSHTTGNGKTSFAIRLLQSYLNAIWYKCDLECKGLFINVPKYLLALKDNISEYNEYANTIKANCLNSDLVIFDDIGTKIATSFEHENLLSIIDYRINEGKSNIFTSNLFPLEIKEFMGDRLYSRIVNSSTCLEFKGQDKRSLKNIM